MERLTIPDVRIDKNTIRRTIIDAEKVKECAMEIYWRLKKLEDVVADEESKDYDLDRLRELVQADRDGRCVVLPQDRMIYFHEESIDGDERWVGNWPIKDVLLKCGFGIASLTYSIKDVGKKNIFPQRSCRSRTERRTGWLST